jgi:SanA protein
VHGDYNEVESMKQFLIGLGVPEDDLLLDENGEDTFETMKNAKQLFRIDEAIVVSQSYHLPRAIYLGTDVGIDLVGVPSDRQPYVRIEWFEFREQFARVKAVIEATFGS